MPQNPGRSSVASADVVAGFALVSVASGREGGHRVILIEFRPKISMRRSHAMAAGPSIDVSGWLEEQLAQASPDLLRAMVTTFAEALLGAEADAVCGAPFGERSTERTNTRNGYRRRDWDTRAGSISLAIPKLRQGSYFPDWLPGRRRRAQGALGTCV